jgi:hypothetical protein
MLLLLSIALATALLLRLGVLPGYRGDFLIGIDGGGQEQLNVKSMQIRETVDQHDTSGTGSATTASKFILQETRIPGKARCRISVQGQYAAGSAGDPPDFSGEALYGIHSVSADAGDTVEGNFNAEEFGNSLNEAGTIDYDLNLISNGAYERT